MVQISSKKASWDDLAAILAVARARSIRRAADELGLAHTTLARRIEAAEAALGIVAFVRGVRGYTLTEAGQSILAHVERMAEEAEAMKRVLAGGDQSPQGTVRITLPPAVLTYCLMPALPKFRVDFPAINLDFDTQYSYSNLDRQEADIAIRYQNAPQDHLVGTCVGTTHECAYATPEVITRLATGDAKLVAWSRAEVFKRRAARFGLGHLEVAFICVDVHGQVGMAEAGLGIAILPTIVGDKSQKLQRVVQGQTLAVRPVWVLTHPDLRKSLRVRTVSAFLIGEMKKSFAERVDVSV
jgi:DNA-binding transcriptional LysR family regulator